ncbi:SDR family oxidoreductase [Saccharopolyspora sp. K220]|uniref:SDR family NAD(P)-dependent oxidoreductase n=1 Tax=Saccharopolyspora soli TaxID=2926618 RepID=UPI001F586E1A|nr:SDR family NAD(P)-dependent oxidoreductase [Saccharopolyspora soli]MCI2419922.1 SDR family oxidoreductase [Saccharopolyspora soli]
MNTVLVTGAAGGVGTAVAISLHERGQRVALLDRDAEGAAALAKSLAPYGTTALPIAADVTEPDSVDGAVRAVVEAWGPLDRIVCCAGLATAAKPFTDTPLATWHQALDVNLMGAVHTARAAIPQLRDGGAIVLVSSVAGVRSRAGLSAYCAAKAAVNSLTQTLALELADRRIRVNCVAPGSLDTGMFAQFGRPGESTADMVARYAPGIPLGRLGTPQEIATAVQFLLDHSASFLTGQVLSVDGGRSL